MEQDLYPLPLGAVMEGLTSGGATVRDGSPAVPGDEGDDNWVYCPFTSQKTLIAPFASVNVFISVA